MPAVGVVADRSESWSVRPLKRLANAIQQRHRGRQAGGDAVPQPLAEPSPTIWFLAAVNHFVLVGALMAGAIAVLVTLALSHRIVRPLELLTAAARQMEKGDLTGRVTVRSGDEIGQLASAFNAMTDGLTRLGSCAGRWSATWRTNCGRHR
jgi:methyl-accepting chemotaxis protein